MNRIELKIEKVEKKGNGRSSLNDFVIFFFSFFCFCSVKFWLQLFLFSHRELQCKRLARITIWTNYTYFNKRRRATTNSWTTKTKYRNEKSIHKYSNQIDRRNAIAIGCFHEDRKRNHRQSKNAEEYFESHKMHDEKKKKFI